MSSALFKDIELVSFFSAFNNSYPPNFELLVLGQPSQTGIRQGPSTHCPVPSSPNHHQLDNPSPFSASPTVGWA